MALFDTTNASSTGVEDGEHVATIVDCVHKEAKSGKGSYLNVRWKLESGPSFFAMYTVRHQNKQAENIGLAQIAEIQLANGMDKGPVETTEDLIGLRCSLICKNETDDYGEKVKIKKHKKAPEAGSF